MYLHCHVSHNWNCQLGKEYEATAASPSPLRRPFSGASRGPCFAASVPCRRRVRRAAVTRRPSSCSAVLTSPRLLTVLQRHRAVTQLHRLVVIARVAPSARPRLLVAASTSLPLLVILRRFRRFLVRRICFISAVLPFLGPPTVFKCAVFTSKPRFTVREVRPAGPVSEHWSAVTSQS
ncbi:hypothetical protein PIB30_030323 [Stylosanthes scabra]|uniref:Uncharacterized protein n=1 Tax=Stylosanthes scabra TaxID=79078 RepID=A0ABU6TC88_9FABA|nr:hypothetical protein [Stylosanthes scabra]